MRENSSEKPRKINAEIHAAATMQGGRANLSNHGGIKHHRSKITSVRVLGDKKKGSGGRKLSATDDDEARAPNYSSLIKRARYSKKRNHRPRKKRRLVRNGAREGPLTVPVITIDSEGGETKSYDEEYQIPPQG